MNVPHCDNHPDQVAVITLHIRLLSPGARPILLGASMPRKFIDLCANCRDQISPTLGKSEHG